MRFLPDGLTIPDELLEGRDQGRVVFLCGAGVSYPAGMPNFLELATYVVKELGTPPDAPSRSVLSMWENENNVPTSARPPVDQIFNLLQQEYAAGEIDYLIAKRLKTKPGACISTHKTILRLSKGTDGKPQIVTTNFDLIPIAQSEPGIEPNGASNDFRWKAVTFEGDGVHPKRLHRNHQIEIRALNVTMPSGQVTLADSSLRIGLRI